VCDPHPPARVIDEDHALAVRRPVSALVDTRQGIAAELLNVAPIGAHHEDATTPVPGEIPGQDQRFVGSEGR
jgi:hypothetical protein